MKSISVFCGSSFNGDPALLQVIEQLADAFTRRDITLVYGGANVGMMGILADAVLNRGGRVIGVLPQFLMDKEIAHTGLTELHIVDSMHARKQLMNELSDGIITIPGGIGTLDEFFEIYTWLQLGLHNNPIGLLNVNGFYNPLVQQLDTMVKQGYLKQTTRQMLLTATGIDDLMEVMLLSKSF